MEGILFFVVWIGGATIHTMLELYLRKSKDQAIGVIKSAGNHQRGRGDDR